MATKGNPAWGTPKKKTSDQKPVAFTKPTYDKTSIFGKSVHAEGKAASKESKKNERKW